MTKVKNGNTVEVYYTGTFNDGTVFDTNVGSDLLKFKVGSNEIIAGFSDAVLGLEAGDKVNVNVKPEKAYGDRNDDLLLKFYKDRMTEEEFNTISVGFIVTIHDDSGSVKIPATVVEKNDEYILVDANHHLAGKELNFEITLVTVN